MDTVAVYDVKDPSKVIDHVIVKVEGRTNRHGVFTYYDPEWGTIVKTENYFLNKLQTGDGVAEGEDGEIKPIGISAGKTKTDSTGKKILTKPQAILDYEKKNSGKKKIKARDGQTGY